MSTWPRPPVFSFCEGDARGSALGPLANRGGATSGDQEGLLGHRAVFPAQHAPLAVLSVSAHLVNSFYVLGPRDRPEIKARPATTTKYAPGSTTCGLGSTTPGRDRQLGSAHMRLSKLDIESGFRARPTPGRDGRVSELNSPECGLAPANFRQHLNRERPNVGSKVGHRQTTRKQECEFGCAVCGLGSTTLGLGGR